MLAWTSGWWPPIGFVQKTFAEVAGVSLPMIRRMEASDGYVRGVVETLTRVVAALDRAGIELIGDDAPSARGGRGVRLNEPAPIAPRRPASNLSIADTEV